MRLDKKNPDAIKKLVKDAGLDPMDIDTSEEPAYREGNHRVSDEEAAFRGVLDDLSATDNGKQTLQVINSTWDQASKELLWKNPSVMNLINQQRELGIYDRILTEVERRKALGQVPINQPLLQIYQQVGQEMVAGRVDDLEGLLTVVSGGQIVQYTTEYSLFITYPMIAYAVS